MISSDIFKCQIDSRIDFLLKKIFSLLTSDNQLYLKGWGMGLPNIFQASLRYSRELTPTVSI